MGLARARITRENGDDTTSKESVSVTEAAVQASTIQCIYIYIDVGFIYREFPSVFRSCQRPEVILVDNSRETEHRS